MLKLNPSGLSYECSFFLQALQERVIGQERAVRTMGRVFQTWRAGLSAPDKPVANLLMLGPTGTGKTRLVEAVAEVLYENPKAFIKINCAEYQREHEISKLIGSPPGYVGSSIKPIITNDVLESWGGCPE